MKIAHPATNLPAARLAEVIGCSLRQAYSYAKGDSPLPAAAAKALELATGVSRLHLLWPEEFTREGYRRQPGATHGA